jgi:uncharacterized membrane protein
MRRRKETTIESELERFDKKKDLNPEVTNEASKEKTVQGVGAEGCSLPSPSGINTWGKPLQVLFFVTYFWALAFGTSLFREILKDYGVRAPDSSKLAIGLGIFYIFVGVSHILSPKDFENIVPLKGTWGIWYVPGSRLFHVLWTSGVEILGGIGLIVGSFLSNAKLVSDCGFVLFFLTVGMTPGNLFMLTHGARLPMKSAPLPLGFHGFRLFVQAWILAALYRLAEDTFEIVL